MLTIFRNSLSRSRGQIIGWGLALFLLGMLSIIRIQLMLENPELIEQLMKGRGRGVVAAFGGGGKVMSPGWALSMAFFSYMPLVLGVFAVMSGSGLLAADEENGTLDLVLAHPITRTDLFLGRLLAFAVALVIVLLISWLGFVVAMMRTPLDVSVWALGKPYLSLLALMLFFGHLALLLSMVLPARRSAAMVAAVILLVSYFLTTLARIDPGLKTVADLSPTTYYQSGDAIDNLDTFYLLGLLAPAVLFSALAWWLFERRDIRVVGEGGWRWPVWWKKKSAPF